jgi:hypothetical protein
MKLKKLKVKSSNLKVAPEVDTARWMEIDEFTGGVPLVEAAAICPQCQESSRSVLSAVPPGLYPPTLPHCFVTVDSKGNEAVYFLPDYKC